MKIKAINLLPLSGSTPVGGWSGGIEKEDNLHTLVEVVTDEGVTGLGSVFTSLTLVEGAVSAWSPAGGR